jgi:RHH-type rel operon transcriptional repressor/antitoxin RelB
MLAIRLPKSIELRLEKLAKRTGRTKPYYVREAILQHLEDLEDVYLAERALGRIHNDDQHHSVTSRHEVSWHEIEFSVKGDHAWSKRVRTW